MQAQILEMNPCLPLFAIGDLQDPRGIKVHWYLRQIYGSPHLCLLVFGDLHGAQISTPTGTSWPAPSFEKP